MNDRKAFFDHVKTTLIHAPSQNQVDGLNDILDAWDKWAPGSDLRFIAYSLATAFRETAETFQPVREAYWLSEEWRKAHLRYYPFYGRGFVQLTWRENYGRADAELRKRGIIGDGDNLIQTPDLALQPELAAPIMIFGMLEGWFTLKRLDQFFTSTKSDAFDARMIINGHDHAADIAGYYLHFLEALNEQRAVDTMNPSVSPPLAVAGKHYFVLGDSIGVGLAAALHCPSHAVEGESVWGIAEWTIPPGLDALIVSAGTNPGLKSAAQMALVEPSLQKIADNAKAAGTKQIVWIRPAVIPRVPREASIVEEFAKARGEPCVGFVYHSPEFHPISYKALADDVRHALGRSV